MPKIDKATCDRIRREIYVVRNLLKALDERLEHTHSLLASDSPEDAIQVLEEIGELSSRVFASLKKGTT